MSLWVQVLEEGRGGEGRGGGKGSVLQLCKLGHECCIFREPSVKFINLFVLEETNKQTNKQKTNTEFCSSLIAFIIVQNVIQTSKAIFE